MASGYGSLATAILKLAAILATTSAIGVFVGGIPGFAINLIVGAGLLAWLFDLEVWELAITLFVLWFVRLVAGFLAVLTLRSMFG